jgi:hypothetical protein
MPAFMPAFMPPTFVMTSTWWLAAPAPKPWGLVVDVHQWPRWWRSVQGVVHHVGTADSAAGPNRTGAPGLAQSSFAAWTAVWRMLLGLPLHLQVLKISQQPSALFEMQVMGDLHARATWLFAPVQATDSAAVGTDITCRWEMQAPVLATGPLGLLVRLLFERQHFARMRNCARDMGQALGCPVVRMGEWSGSWRRR